jgi:hypothetical protein
MHNYLNELGINHPIKPLLEGFELLFDVLVEQVLAVLIHILFLVALMQFNVITILFDLNHLLLAKVIELDVEVQL